MKVVVGTHPIQEKYLITHTNLKTMESAEWEEFLKPTICNQKTRLAYN